MKKCLECSKLEKVVTGLLRVIVKNNRLIDRLRNQVPRKVKS